MSVPIGDRNIPGLRVRDLITILGCTISVLLSGSIAYAKLIGRMDRIEDTRVLELRLSTLEAAQAATNREIDAIKTDVLINRGFIKTITNDNK